jgi:hypothetical protein
LTTSIAATSLAAVVGIEGVAVTFRGVPAGRTVAGVLAVRVVRLRGLRGEPLRGWRRPRWGHAAGPLTVLSTLAHHPPLATFAGSLVLVLNHNGSVHHGFQIRIWHSYQIGLQLLVKSIEEQLPFLFVSVNVIRGVPSPSSELVEVLGDTHPTLL